MCSLFRYNESLRFYTIKITIRYLVLSQAFLLTYSVWLASYSDHSQSVTITGSLASPCYTSSGVSQGSILSLSLLILYIYDITKLPLPSTSIITRYAGDTLLSHPLSSFPPSTQFNLIQTLYHRGYLPFSSSTK